MPSLSRYEHRLAYRHANGEAEGFLGTGGTKPNAKADAIDQIKRKVDRIAAGNPEAPGFDKSRVIEALSLLTRAELDAVKADWGSGVRY